MSRKRHAHSRKSKKSVFSKVWKKHGGKVKLAGKLGIAGALALGAAATAGAAGVGAAVGIAACRAMRSDEDARMTK